MKLYWSQNTRAFRIAWLMEESGWNTNASRSISVTRSPRVIPPSGGLPAGKVPALEDGPARLSDSGAICIYLADQYPATQLGPPVGHADRASFLQWVTYTNSVIEPSMAEKFAKLEPRPASYGWEASTSWSRPCGRAVEKEWILGARFSAADVLLGTSTAWLMKFGLHSADDAMRRTSPGASAPAWKRAEAFDSP